MKKLGIVALCSLIGVVAQASIVVDTQTYYVYGAATNNFTSLNAVAGDMVIVMSSGNNTVVTDSLVSSLTWDDTATKSVGARASYYYAAITADTTVDISVEKVADGHSTYGVYLLHSDAGNTISVLDTQLFGANPSTTTDLVYDFAGSSESGVYLESFASYNTWAETPGVNQFIGGVKFGVGQGTFTGVTSLSHTYTVNSDGSDAQALTGLAFNEVIPEPATLGLVAVVGGGILFIRRRSMT